MSMTSKLTTWGLLATLAVASIVPALADDYQNPSRTQSDKNTMRNLGIGAAAIAALGVLNHNGTATLLGAAGAALAGNQYEKDRKRQSQNNDHRYYRNNRDWNNNGQYNDSQYNDNQYNNDRYNSGYDTNQYGNNQYGDNRHWNGNNNGSRNNDDYDSEDNRGNGGDNSDYTVRNNAARSSNNGNGRAKGWWAHRGNHKH